MVITVTAIVAVRTSLDVYDWARGLGDWKETVAATAAADSAQMPVVLQKASEALPPLMVSSTILLVWLGLLGGALAVRRRAHLGVDALVQLYPRRVRFALDYFSTALLAVFSLGVMVWGGYQVCAKAVETHSMTPGLESFNRAWFYAALPIAGALNFIYCIHAFFHPKPIGLDSDEGGDE